MFEVIILKGKANQIYYENGKISDPTYVINNHILLITCSDHDVHIKPDMLA